MDSNGVLLGLICFDHMQALHLVLLTHRLYERMIIRVHYLKMA